MSTTEMFRRLDELATITDEVGITCRTFLSPAMERVNDMVGGWMREAGCEVRVDGWGNLIGHLPAGSSTARTLLLGSHLDTVRNAGKFDGPLGVLVALEALKNLASAGILLPFQVDIIGFSDEEGTRFHSAYLGSKALAGMVTNADLALLDEQGISVGTAVAKFQRTHQLELPVARYQTADVLGYVEVHIEQGPVLEEKDMAVGVVDFIAAQNRFLFTFEGRAGHAGTTPMDLRKDALAGAAEFILAVERIGRETPGLVATVGQLQVGPNVSNVIPDRIRLSLDIRHADGKIVNEASQHLRDLAQTIADHRKLLVTNALIQGVKATPCSGRLNQVLEEAVRQHQTVVPHLVSGAGHDGVILSHLTEIAMLFVRCKGGLSHHPEESVTEADFSIACLILVDFLLRLK